MVTDKQNVSSISIMKEPLRPQLRENCNDRMCMSGCLVTRSSFFLAATYGNDQPWHPWWGYKMRRKIGHRQAYMWQDTCRQAFAKTLLPIVLSTHLVPPPWGKSSLVAKILSAGTWRARKGHVPEKFLMKQGQWCSGGTVRCALWRRRYCRVRHQHEECSSVE
jgi:hypothetical protein